METPTDSAISLKTESSAKSIEESQHSAGVSPNAEDDRLLRDFPKGTSLSKRNL